LAACRADVGTIASCPEPRDQRDAVVRFAAAEDFEIVAEFVEIETGKGADALDRRPQLD
jgi:hypothetical protein